MKRAKFSLSHHRLFTCDMGQLVPCGLLEVLPGDSFQQATVALVRCSPLVSPPMHPVEVRIHHWYVPLRLLWEDFEDFITGGPDGMDASVFPTITMPGGGGAAVSSLADYLGVPTGVNSLAVSALPFRAYGKIFNEWYRDQDLVTSLVVSEASGADTTTNTTLQRIAWEKDYFTSGRPWEQKGPSITIPIGSQAPVSGMGIVNSAVYTNASTGYTVPAGTSSTGTNWATGSQTFAFRGNNTTKVPDLYADLSGASAVTVNALREALALQRYEEARARFGSRYTEYLRYLGIRSSDARLQRPEYLGGGKQMIQFSEVLQTSETGTTPLGELGGHGISAMRSNRYRRFFEEHGYVLSLMSVRPKTIYMDGLKRTWNRRTKEDFYQRELEHIGQQEVLNKEVYAAHGTPNGVFAYQDRYDEYRREESYISGEFRTTLDSWHFGRSFASDPALNASFVQCVPPETPFADQTANVLWIMARHSVQARRILTKTGTSFIF